MFSICCTAVCPFVFQFPRSSAVPNVASAKLGSLCWSSFWAKCGPNFLHCFGIESDWHRAGRASHFGKHQDKGRCACTTSFLSGFLLFKGGIQVLQDFGPRVQNGINSHGSAGEITPFQSKLPPPFDRKPPSLCVKTLVLHFAWDCTPCLACCEPP